MNEDRPPNWNKVSTALREVGVGSRPADEDLSAPLGFSSKIVSRYQADRRADGVSLLLWRRWALTGAACAVLLYGGTFFLNPAEPTAKPIIPVPTLDLESPNLTER